MQTSVIDRVVGVGIHDARVWLLSFGFLLLFLVFRLGFSAFFLISDGLIVYLTVFSERVCVLCKATR